MHIFSLIVASLITVPQATPEYLQRIFDGAPVGKSGAVQLRTWLDPEGKIYRCEALKFFGDKVSERIACAPFLGASMKPAAAPDGSASYGSKMTLLRFMGQGRQGRAIQEMNTPADLHLAFVDDVTSLAPVFSIAVQVQPDGSIGHCEGIEGASGELVDRACAEVARLGQPTGTDTDGKPISYVTSLLVRVEASGA